MPSRSVLKFDTESMQKDMDNAKARGEELLDSADTKTRQITENAMTELSELARSLNSRLKDIGIDTAKVADNAKESAASLEARVGEELVAHPLRSLAIAAGIGLLLGAMTRK